MYGNVRWPVCRARRNGRVGKASGKGAGAADALGRECVEVGGADPVVAVGAEVVFAEGVEYDEDDVHGAAPGRRLTVNAAAVMPDRQPAPTVRGRWAGTRGVGVKGGTVSRQPAPRGGGLARDGFGRIFWRRRGIAGTGVPGIGQPSIGWVGAIPGSPGRDARQTRDEGRQIDEAGFQVGEGGEQRETPGEIRGSGQLYTK